MKWLVIIILVAILCLTSLQGFGYDTASKRQGKIYTNKNVDTTTPARFKPSSSKNLEDWLNILPYPAYKYHNQYLVIPAMGMVTPIMELPKTSAEYKRVIKGGTFNYNPYLEGGPVLYPGTASIGQTGNAFIFGHSSFFVNKPGFFKTIFKLLYNVEPGDAIYVYKKVDNRRKIYEYQVTASTQVKETDVRVMLSEKDKTTLTLSACWPIGTIKDRWINRATLLSTKRMDEVVTNLPIEYIPFRDTAKTH